MNEFLAHLLGDYILQSHQVAQKKTSDSRIALLHGVLYTMPFVLLTRSIPRLLIIALTHALIDRYRLANWIARIKNWHWLTTSGYPAETPVWLSTWLMIITDNTMHMLINYWTLRYRRKQP